MGLTRRRFVTLKKAKRVMESKKKIDSKEVPAGFLHR